MDKRISMTLKIIQPGDKRRAPEDHRRADGALGDQVSVVEVKDVEILQNMQRAMARQAESERERRA